MANVPHSEHEATKHEVEMVGGLLFVVAALCLLGWVLLAIAKGWLT